MSVLDEILVLLLLYITYGAGFFAPARTLKGVILVNRVPPTGADMLEGLKGSLRYSCALFRSWKKAEDSNAVKPVIAVSFLSG